MIKPIHLLKRMVRLIKENNIRTDHVTQLEYQNFEESLEQLENYLNTDFPNIEAVYLSLDLSYSGIVRNGNKYRGYTLLKATIENGLLTLRLETGREKYVADEITTIYQNLQHRDSDFFIEEQEDINSGKYERFEDFLEVKHSQFIDYNDFYEATILFDGVDALYYIDKELINQVKNLFEKIRSKSKCSNSTFLQIQLFLKELDNLPNLPDELYKFELKFREGIYLTVEFSDENFLISEYIYDGDYSTDGFRIKYEPDEIYPKIEGDTNSWLNLKNEMALYPELLNVSSEEMYVNNFDFENDWKINNTDFLNIEQGEADYYSNAGYKGQMKFQGIEANIHGQVRAFGGQYRFDFTFVGVRNFQPVSGAGWLSHNDDKLMGQIKVHGENPKSITLSD